MVTIGWEGGKVRFLDQTLLPQQVRSVLTDDYRVVGEALRALQIRGAPAIGVAAAFGAALALCDTHLTSLREGHDALGTALSFLAATRPTAVNLFTSLQRIRHAADDPALTTLDALRQAVVQEALAIRREDVESCAELGRLGASLIERDSALLTHCNTGALATAGEGTALAAILEAHRQGKVTRVFVDETRPLLQGARLTTWELMQHGIETTLITDSTAATVLSKGWVRTVLVGADRIAANGDVANKVGTYPLAVLAARHRVPFLVVAPTSTIDLATPDGYQIPIEERSPREVTHVAGQSVAPEGTHAFCPAFDVTPNDLVTAIVTERGILRPPFSPALERACRRRGEER
jgi:methylthioribose-1-phosphate isomerase